VLIRRIGLAAALSVYAALPAAAQAPPPAASAAKEHATAIKDNLQKSLAALRQYQWVETTVISMKGEEKSRKQESCYYGADGKVQKTPIGAPAPPAKEKRGLRGKIIENKKEEIAGSVKQAVALVKQYVPPDPAKIQAARAAGKLSVSPPDAGGKVQLVIKDYVKAGDALTLIANTATDQLSDMVVTTYADTPKDAVSLKVRFGSFQDGTAFPANINLAIASQQLGIAITNSGYKKGT
jgi:hypothetical protein